MEIKVYKMDKLSSTKWSGGTTTQLYIIPEGKTAKDEFDIRISTATIDPGESSFSDFSGYNRFLTIVKGNLEISHNNEEYKFVEKYIPYYFDGETPTKSKANELVKDFNVIWNKKIEEDKIKIMVIDSNTFLRNNITGKVFVFNFEERCFIESDNRTVKLSKNEYLEVSNSNSIKIDGKAIYVEIK